MFWSTTITIIVVIIQITKVMRIMGYVSSVDNGVPILTESVWSLENSSYCLEDDSDMYGMAKELGNRNACP